MQYKLYKGLHKPERTKTAALMNKLSQKDTKEGDNDLLNKQKRKNLDHKRERNS